jgi:hypothetical protein
MNRILKSMPQILALIIFVSLLLGLLGCATPQGEGFAIYLTRDNVPPAKMEALSRVDLADQPIISMQDIISYDSATYEITLTPESFERIINLKVPLSGASFMVCVDKNPVYWGAFWTPISSMSFSGVTIWKPFTTREQNTIKLELGYPAPSFYKGEDPRNNLEVLKSLEQAGRLITSMFPHSMKGYELYSWTEDGQWRFALITGTNRNKTAEEIISTINTISQDGWVHIRVESIDQIKQVLSRIPQNEYVSWLSGPPPPQGGITFSLPPAQIVDDIKQYPAQTGLNFNIPGR